MARKTRISHCQVLYAMARASGKSPREAARQAGYTNVTRRRIYQLEHNPNLQEYVEEHLAAEGITMELIAHKVREGLDAMTTSTFLNRLTGEVVYSRPLEDMQTRHKYLTTLLDLLGLSGRLRNEAGKEAAPVTDILLLARRFEHLTDTELEEAMQLMRIGQFDPVGFGCTSDDPVDA